MSCKWVNNVKIFTNFHPTYIQFHVFPFSLLPFNDRKMTIPRQKTMSPNWQKCLTLSSAVKLFGLFECFPLLSSITSPGDNILQIRRILPYLIPKILAKPSPQTCSSCAPYFTCNKMHFSRDSCGCMSWHLQRYKKSKTY